MVQDVMSVEYTELDNGTPCLCFCSDLSIPLTNKTMVKTYINYMDNDLKFKIIDLRIQDLMFFYMGPDVTAIKAKVNGKFEQMGFVSTDDLLECMRKVLKTLEDWTNEI